MKRSIHNCTGTTVTSSRPSSQCFGRLLAGLLIGAVPLPIVAEPTKRNTSVGELAKNLGVSFATLDLPLSVVKLARHCEQLQFEVQLLRHELRARRWWHAFTRRPS